ncbi:MAG: carbon-nitrogen hydrolase [Firmicutes bacterium]|nr:carbon-nitrogen hydrolase [Bacillota bacterium]
MRQVTVACTQMRCGWDREANIAKAEQLIREAAAAGANIIQIQELFETPYFAQIEDYDYLDLARPREGNPMLEHICALARELKVVLPMSFFEDAEVVRYNTTAVIDADGSILGYYRKTHIPDDMGYYEKFYFSPGDSGFQVWDTKYAKIGVGICWDQWFPEAARIMCLKGAELLFYPTAIGTFAVPEAELDQADADYRHWQNVMLGHAAANMAPVIASNRIGDEREPKAGTAIRFWGASFISDNIGEKIAEMDGMTEGFAIASFDRDELAAYRREVVTFRDRRPEMYGHLMTMGGKLL